MTANSYPHGEPLSEKASRLLPVARSVDRTHSVREPSLLELTSLADWYRFVPETLGILLVIALIGVWRSEASTGGTMPHPFWIPVLLMSGQYGIMGGLFAALAATAALFFSGLPPQSAAQDFYAYAGVVAAQPFAWFATALVMGGLRTLHRHHQTDVQERLDHTERLAEDLADGLERAVGEIERLEQRIAGDSGTLGCFLHSLTKLEMSDRRSLVSSVADVIRYGVGATSFAIYLKGKNGLEPYLCVEDGSLVAPATIAPLAPSLLNAVRGEGIDSEPTAGGNCFGDMLRGEPIYLAGTTKRLGVIICSRLEPSRNPAISMQRLGDVCRVLAALLPSCPAVSSGDCGCDNS